MKIVFRWIIIIAIALALGIVVTVAYLGIDSPAFQLYLICFCFIGTWIGSGRYLKKINKVKQPFAYGFMIAMFVTYIVMLSLNYLFPSKEEMQKRATDAENEYFVLSGASLDHDRICNAAIKAYKYNLKLNNEERVGMFKYALVQDKCL